MRQGQPESPRFSRRMFRLSQAEMACAGHSTLRRAAEEKVEFGLQATWHGRSKDAALRQHPPCKQRLNLRMELVGDLIETRLGWVEFAVP